MTEKLYSHRYIDLLNEPVVLKYLKPELLNVTCASFAHETQFSASELMKNWNDGQEIEESFILSGRSALDQDWLYSDTRIVR